MLCLWRPRLLCVGLRVLCHRASRYLVISGTFLNWLRRPVGRFTINEQRLEGDYRHVNSRVIQHSYAAVGRACCAWLSG